MGRRELETCRQRGLKTFLRSTKTPCGRRGRTPLPPSSGRGSTLSEHWLTSIIRLRPTTTACYEECQRDDCRRRQEKADIQSPAGIGEQSMQIEPSARSLSTAYPDSVGLADVTSADAVWEAIRGFDELGPVVPSTSKSTAEAKPRLVLRRQVS
jgi:hypothetical protein